MEPRYSFDHAMVLVNDVSSATTSYTGMGFTIAEGGQVGNGWLQNAGVLFLDGSYVELLGFRPVGCYLPYESSGGPAF